MKPLLNVIKRDTLSFYYNSCSIALIKYTMSLIGRKYHLFILIPTLVCLASTVGIVPTVQPNTIYGDGGSFSFNLAPYAATTSARLSFTLTFTGRVQATTDYLFGYAIQEINYLITDQKLNYSVTATGAKTATSIMANLFTSHLNKITILNIYYIIIQPLFGNYQFYYTWLFPNMNFISGQQFNATIVTAFPINITGGSKSWTTIVGVDASLASNKQVDIYVSATALTATTINFKVSTISPVSFYLTSVIIGAYIFNYDELNNNNRLGRFNTGNFGSVGTASALTYTDSSGFVRTTNTILGTNTYHIVNQNYLHIKCVISPNNVISATTNYSFSYMAFNYLQIVFVYCNPANTPYLHVASKLCYATCPERTYPNVYKECTACQNYDCYTCDSSGACLTCSSGQDFRQFDSSTNRCRPLTGYYDNGVSVAVACNPANCLTCTSNTYCLTCASGKYLTGTNTCLACLSNCLQCTTSSNCQQCATFYSFGAGACNINCNITNCATCSVSGGSLTCTACSQGYQLSGSTTCNPHCGDGYKLSSEGCDDGNTASGDGCSSTCVIQSGFYCTVASSRSTCQSCIANCNSCTSGTNCQSCAAGYTFSASSCSFTCSFSNCETCAVVSGSPTCTVCSQGYQLSGSNCNPVCGDGYKLSSEGCDDGNTASGDGCSSTCVIQSGFYCTVASSRSTCQSCIANCNSCTSGTNCQTCAAGYTFSASSCSFTCSITNCATCAVVGGTVTCTACSQGYQLSGSACVPVCGDGFKLSSQGCDDGNTASGDGCSSVCAIQSGFYCTIASSRSTCQSCMANCDTCTSGTNCQSCATGYIFSSSTSQCVLRCSSNCNIVCGNGLHETGEGCDDGNLQSNDGCTSNCAIEQNYECTDDSSSKSICNLLSLDIQKSLLQKQQSDNSAQFCFSISTGNDNRFISIDWKTVVAQSTSIGLTIKDISFEQDQQALCFIGTYTQDIDNKQFQVSFTFPNRAPFQRVSSVRKQFILRSDNNLALKVYSDLEYSMAQILRFTLRFLSFAVLFSLFLGLFRLKLIPLQLAFVFQVAGLSIMSLQRLSPTFYCLNQLSWVVFFYRLNLFDESMDVQRYFKAFGFNFNLFNNYNIAASIFIGPLLIGSVLFLLKKCKKSRIQDKLSIASSMLLGEYSFYGLMIGSYNIIISACNHSIRWRQVNSLQKICLAGIALILCLFLIHFVGQLVHKGYFGNYDQFFRRNSFYSNSYYCLIMVEKIFFGCCITLLSFPYRTSILIVPYLFLLIAIAIKKPYSQQSGNVRPALNNIFIILILAIVLCQDFMVGVRIYEMYAPFGIAGCLILAFLINTYFYVRPCFKSKEKSQVAPKLENIINYSFSKRKLDGNEQQQGSRDKQSVSGRETYDSSPVKMNDSDIIAVKRRKRYKQTLDEPQKAIQRIQQLNEQLTFENPMIMAFRSNKSIQKRKAIKSQRRSFSNDLLLIKESLAQIRDASQARRNNVESLEESNQAFQNIQQ